LNNAIKTHGDVQPQLL